MISVRLRHQSDLIKERPLRYYRTTGLMLTQMQELACRIHEALTEPWNKGTGRPKSCGLYAAIALAFHEGSADERRA